MSWGTNQPSRRTVIGSLLAAPVALRAPSSLAADRAPAGKLVIAFHVTISPAWFDPSLAPPQITPFGILYALHDALVRAYPGTKMGPALAESWNESEDGLTYEFKLRPGLTFHNGDPLTTEDVKFSFDRYKGAGATVLKEKVKQVEIVDPRVIRFHLNEVWPDFMTFYGSTASAVGLVVPKKYIEKVGEKGFTAHPIGAGPYKFVSSQPGIEVVFEAFDHFWRHVPYVKTIVMRSVPDGDTRALMVKTGEADIAIALQGVAAQGLMDNKGTKIVASKHASSPMDRVPRPVRPEIAVARQADAACGRLCDRSRGDQQGRLPRLLPAGRGHCPAGHAVRVAGQTRSPTIPRRRSTCSPRPAIRTASTPGSSPPSRASRRPPRRWSTTSMQSASGSVSGRWNAQRSTPTGGHINSTGCT